MHWTAANGTTAPTTETAGTHLHTWSQNACKPTDHQWPRARPFGKNTWYTSLRRFSAIQVILPIIGVGGAYQVIQFVPGESLHPGVNSCFPVGGVLTTVGQKLWFGPPTPFGNNCSSLTKMASLLLLSNHLSLPAKRFSYKDATDNAPHRISSGVSPLALRFTQSEQSEGALTHTCTPTCRRQREMPRTKAIFTVVVP